MPLLPRWLTGGSNGKQAGGPKSGPDEFPLLPEHPLSAEHELIAEILAETGSLRSWETPKFKEAAAGRRLHASSGEETCRLIRALAQRVRHAHSFLLLLPNGHTDQEREPWATHENALTHAIALLLRRKLPLTLGDFDELLEWQASKRWTSGLQVSSVVRAYAKILDGAQPPEPQRARLEVIRKLLAGYTGGSERKTRELIDDLLGTSPALHLIAGETWADAALTDIGTGEDAVQVAWRALLQHCARAEGGKPNQRWQKTARAAIEDVGESDVHDSLLRWFPLVDDDAPAPIALPNEDALKGLAWCGGVLALDEPSAVSALARALTSLALAGYHKVPALGPRSLKVGNACLWSLGQLPGLDGVGQLALLKVRVRHRAALKGIDKALAQVAERAGVSPTELEEMGVPDYGLTEVGRACVALGEFEALLEVTGTTSTSLTWRNSATGKVTKSVPAAVKRDQPEELKDLKAMGKDIQKMLPAQRDRLDSLFLEERRWPYAVWQERYLEHPLVGSLARRLLWRLHQEDGVRTVLPHAGVLEDVEGAEAVPAPDAEISLWHPLDESTEAVLGWRARLAELGVVQPFKQAHREVYVLTDAERATAVYSNRFAAHILRQHQFNALCGARGWRNSLRLLVDDEYPPATRVLPVQGLRAEFWVEGMGDDYGVHTNEAGSFLYLTTDQVRFYPEGAAPTTAHAGGGGYRRHGEGEPLALDQVPPLVLSEILRDVDLFVGVASVGNDPAWQDGGREEQEAAYWQAYSFGNLSETAKTRRQLLEALVPKLKIAERCTLDERFLHVRGDLREYRIHLGSGNILMEPNDEYLCIVPSQVPSKGAPYRVFLPFEGDRVLSIILSKAYLLAADLEITDATILSQLKRS